MASSGESDDNERVVPFPNCSPPPAEPVNKMHLNLAGLGLCDDLTDALKQERSVMPDGLSTKSNGRAVGLALGATILVTISIWGHFHSLSLMESLRHNPGNLDYDELVTWGNTVVRKVSHFKLLSNIALGTAFSISLVWLTRRQNTKQ